LEVRDEIASAIGEHWETHPVIVTAQPAANIMATDLRSAAEVGVVVLAAEALSCLAEQPPDVRPFWEAFNRAST
jgi:hypothetical protein